MREELAKLFGKRRRFQGVFVRFGQKSGYKGVLTTILLKDIVDVISQKTVADHCWFTMGKRFEKLELKEGDIIRFYARVTDYVKGYQGRRGEDDYDYKPVERDFRLSFPTKFVKVSPSVAVSPLLTAS
jgi:hypothetical protein